MNRKVTIKDVAKTAGVSFSTVSRVMTRSSVVKAETREKVLKAVKKMGYFPNILARSLRNIHSNTIGLVIPDIRNPFFADVAKGVEDAARKTGYHVFLCNTGNDEEEERIAINLCKVIT